MRLIFIKQPLLFVISTSMTFLTSSPYLLWVHTWVFQTPPPLFRGCFWQSRHICIEHLLLLCLQMWRTCLLWWPLRRCTATFPRTVADMGSKIFLYISFSPFLCFCLHFYTRFSDTYYGVLSVDVASCWISLSPQGVVGVELLIYISFHGNVSCRMPHPSGLLRPILCSDTLHFVGMSVFTEMCFCFLFWHRCTVDIICFI